MLKLMDGIKEDSHALPKELLILDNTILAGILDLNGDGYDEAVVVDTCTGNGSVSLHLGSATPAVSPIHTLSGEAAGDRFGPVAAGDFNGDGRTELLVGAPYNDAGGADAGKAYICITFGGR